MMMGGDRKSIAIIIAGGSPIKKEYAMQDALMGNDEKEDDKEEAFFGVEAAMEKFIKAIKEEDVKKAVEAMYEFQEMSSGFEYFNDEMME